MQHQHLEFTEGFRVAITSERAQAAVMVIAPEGSEGGPDNRHRGADQWLYVIEGCGLAVVDGREVGLYPGTLVRIEAGEAHEVRNTGTAPLKTLNFYDPPAYSVAGDEMAAGKP